MMGITRRNRPQLFKLTAFFAFSAIVAAYLFIVTDDSRFGSSDSYQANFADVSGLEKGDEIRVASVPIGKVSKVEVQSDTSVLVSFSIDKAIHMTKSVTATVRYKNLLGDRFVELDKSGNSAAALAPGGMIPITQTKGALNLDTLLNGFKPLFVGLNPKQINQLSDELVQVLQGQSGAVYTLVASVASFTTTIAQRDELIGGVIDNLNSVLGTVAERDKNLGDLIDQLSTLTSGLAKDAPSITASIDHIDSFAGTASALLAETKTDLNPNLKQLSAVAGTLNKNSDTIQQILTRLPDHYDRVSRTGSFGNFFNFFLCGVRLKLADSAGSPVYTPWINSDVSRCQ